MKGDYLPEIIYVTREAKEDPLSQRIISRLPNAQVFEVDSNLDPLSEKSAFGKDSSELERFNLGKRRLFLLRYKGDWIRACPGTSQHVCCNLFTINPGEGCPLDCTYCYLQTYLKRNPTLKLYTNTSDMLEAINDKVSSNPNRLFRIGTGELIDSLVWDELSDSTLELVPFFAKFDNATLELKTKTDRIDNLVSLKNKHNEKTVVSWSVNASSVNVNDEAMTVSVNERIQAAAKVIEAGYRVGFHFDPLIYFDGWEDEYSDLVKNIQSNIDMNRIAWISVSTLRYKPDMQEIMIKRFPQSKIPYGEQFLAKDGKLRYIQPLRFKMINFIWDLLKKPKSDLPVYMCMESSFAWKQISGGAPVAGSELVEVFSRRGRLPVVS